MLRPRLESEPFRDQNPLKFAKDPQSTYPLTLSFIYLEYIWPYIIRISHVFTKSFGIGNKIGQVLLYKTKTYIVDFFYMYSGKEYM